MDIHIGARASERLEQEVSDARNLRIRHPKPVSGMNYDIFNLLDFGDPRAGISRQPRRVRVRGDREEREREDKERRRRGKKDQEESSRRKDLKSAIHEHDVINYIQKFLTNVYGPPSWAGKEAFCSELLSLKDVYLNRWVICGDFNCTKNQSERKGLPWSRKTMAMFSDLINNLEVIDLPLSNQSYTWSNMQHRPTLAKLDRFLVSTDWDLSFPLSKVTALPRHTKEGKSKTAAPAGFRGRGNSLEKQAQTNLTKGRKRVNTIDVIEDEEGVQLHGEELKQSFFYRNFRCLFGQREERPQPHGNWSALYQQNRLLNPELLTMRNLCFLWKIFEWASGLRINLGKSELYYLGDRPQKAAKLANILGCVIGHLPFRYL
ncbi:hypothetical protein ACMD2_06552, partial [Ananas comosus]